MWTICKYLLILRRCFTGEINSSILIFSRQWTAKVIEESSTESRRHLRLMRKSEFIQEFCVIVVLIYLIHNAVADDDIDCSECPANHFYDGIIPGCTECRPECHDVSHQSLENCQKCCLEGNWTFAHVSILTSHQYQLLTKKVFHVYIFMYMFTIVHARIL